MVGLYAIVLCSKLCLYKKKYSDQNFTDIYVLQPFLFLHVLKENEEKIAKYKPDIYVCIYRYFIYSCKIYVHCTTIQNGAGPLF